MTFEFKDDRLIYDAGTLSRPYGEPDASGRVEVLYTQILELPSPPKEEVDQWVVGGDRVFVPAVGRTIVFVLGRSQERNMGPLDETLHGPYLVEKGLRDEKTFVDIWEERSDENLFSIFKETFNTEKEFGFYKRYAAARVLARRQHQPTAEVLMEWLENPRQGVGRYVDGYQYGTATTEPDIWYADDANERQVLHLAAESLGLMGKALGHQKIKVALESSLDNLSNEDFGIAKENRRELDDTVRRALRRLDNPDEPETDVEDDMLVYATISPISSFSSHRTPYQPPIFFRGREFKWLANQMISAHGRKLAERYIEALRRVPNIKIPTESGEIDIISRVGCIGVGYGYHQEPFERLCQNLFDIVKTSRGLENGRDYIPIEQRERKCGTIVGYRSVRLYDDSSPEFNDGVLMEIKRCLAQNSR